MSRFVMNFGSYNKIAVERNDGLEFKKYNSFITYGSDSPLFKSSIKITENNVVIGNNAKAGDNSIYIENLAKEFKNTDKVYPLGLKKYTMNAIAEKYFLGIKNELDSHQKNEPIDSMTLIIPYEYTQTNKQNLKNILNNIHFKVNEIIEEPIAHYFGYIKTNHLSIPRHDTFMMLHIEYDGIIAKIFDVEKVNPHQLTFKLDSNSYDMTFELYDLLRNYFLKHINIHKTYNELTKTDKEALDEGIQSLIIAVQDRNNHESDLYAYLPDECVEIDVNYTSDAFEQLLLQIGIFDKIKSVIDNCLEESNKSSFEIKKIIYTGEASIVYGIQEKMNRDYHMNQNIMMDVEKLACVGGLVANQYYYTIEDHCLRIGMMKKVKKGFFKTIDIFNECIPSYSPIISASIKRKIPQGFNGKLEIYEGYNGASKNDCILLNTIDISKYCDGHHRLEIERKAMGGMISVVIYDSGGQEVIRLKVK